MRVCFEQILSRHCARHYSGSCLKLDVLRIVNSLHNNSYQILPGISLKFGRAKGGGGGAGGKGQVPLEVVRSIAQENETAEFDKYFYEKIKSQLNSASIHFRLFDDNPAPGKTLDTSIWSDLYKTIRGKKGTALAFQSVFFIYIADSRTEFIRFRNLNGRNEDVACVRNLRFYC